MDEKLTVCGRMSLVEDIDTDAKREMIKITLVFHFTSFLFLELFCFALILKCGGLHILGLGGRTMNTRRALLHLLNPELLQIG